ncbi:hypothetical protein SynRS9902_02160 [Synechococcus sp. RS9902]|nr:hypothetical protein SynRS9902_02160 [Synechococcus sp. RS9902]
MSRTIHPSPFWPLRPWRIAATHAGVLVGMIGRFRSDAIVRTGVRTEQPFWCFKSTQASR